MNRHLVLTFLLLLYSPLFFAQAAKTGIVLTDIDNFWDACDRIQQSADSAERIRLLNELYLGKGSEGLKGIIAARGYEAQDFVDAILKYPKYWNSIRSNTAQLDRDKALIEQYFAQLRAVYPDLRPATIYFPVGAFRSAGTYEGDKVLLGAEFMLAHENADLSELPEWVRNAIASSIPYDIPLTALHELIHTQQVRWEHLSIVHRSVAEGVAEFISTLIAEQPVSGPVKFGKENAQQVLDTYMIEIFRDDDVGNWLWGKNQNALEVNDLGYYIGYEICERHYQKAADKAQAIRELIELDFANDTAFAKFVDGAGFLPMSWEEIGIRYESMRPTVTGIVEFRNGSRKVKSGTVTLTLRFSEPMSACCRSFDHDPAQPGEALPVKKVIGWSADMREFSMEVGPLQPRSAYQLILSNMAKEDGGNRIAPYTIAFQTR